MRNEFDDRSTYIYKVIENLHPIVTSTNYRRFYPSSVNYLEATTKYENRTIPDAKEKGFLELQKACQDANTEYKEALSYYKQGKGNLGKDALKDKHTQMEVANKDYAKLLRSTYRYSANLRTLLLYLLNERHAERPDIRRVRKVLSIVRIEVAPFLKYWQDFEQCGCDIRNILFRIAEEFRSQMHICVSISDFLLPTVMERYLAELEEFFSLADFVGFSTLFETNKQMKKDKFDMLPEIQNEYRKWIIPHMQQSMERRLKSLQDYERKVDTFEFIREARHRQQQQEQTFPQSVANESLGRG